MKQWLAPAHLALTLVIIVWDVMVAGRIAQLRQASKPFAAMTGLAGLLIVPAFIIAVATTTVITGRALSAVDWIWPATITLVAAQAIVAVSRRYVSPLWGYPIVFYDVVLAIAAIARLLAAHGVGLPRPLLLVMASQIDALALATTEAAIVSPFFLHVPLVAPAFPALSRFTGGVRGVMAAIALVWFGLIVAELPRADSALASYDSHAADRLHERPGGFTVGLKVFPDVRKAVSAASVKADIETAEFTNISAMNVVFVPGASTLAIDSVARTLDLLQRDSLIVIATIGYTGDLLPELGRVPLNTEERLATIRRVLTRLRPDVIVPAEDPYGLGARVLGVLPVDAWQSYFTRAAAVVREVRPRTRIGLAAAAFDTRDSTLFAWASTPGSPIDMPGFSFYPSRLGARSMDAAFRAADRWMRANPPQKPIWVFGAGGYPLAHGEASQDRAMWAAITWATSHREVKGFIVNEANDYGRAMGVRAPDGHYRRAAFTVQRSIRALRETFGQPSTASPTP